MKLESLNAPRSKALRVLRGDARRRPVGSSEDDGDRLQPGRHVVGLGCRVDDLVDGLHGEVKGHELTDGPQAGLEGANRDLCLFVCLFIS